MLGAARDEQGSIVQHARNDGTDRATNMALLIHIAVVQHSVRLAAYHAIARRLALHESGADARGFVGRYLRFGGEA